MGQPFGLEAGTYQSSPNFESGQGKSHGNGTIDFGGSTNLCLQNNQVNFGSNHQQLSPYKSSANGQSSQDDDLMALVRDLIQQIAQSLLQFMQQNQNGNTDSSKNNFKGNSSPNNSITPQDAMVSPPVQNIAATQPPVPESTSVPTSSSTPTAQADAAKPSEVAPKTDSYTSVGGGQTAGSGPYSMNISNTQDHEVKIGQFDQNEKLIGEITLAPKGQPGSTGTMKYQADTTTLMKQADEDGQYRPDASRLEAYNGFINTSYIDGRNASIHASDGKGFEIGDSKSIAEEAKKAGLINNINDTIPGWYDGSTTEMQEGGKFLEKELGTGDSYIHPNDDQLGQGKNPMRHTDSMTLNVEFGEA
ncbi:hypothetical protein GCM10009425_49180 [Pseudomonas asuensis]|uniref:Uncharacterized protein n=1 Tax=Pseudomonas asuensis TaxID=1825787 RepID=A0ABQ2H3S5_9PSED|nr:hypothetical protein GCM10009425_49180 [Pseudomonas asuensis]